MNGWWHWMMLLCGTQPALGGRYSQNNNKIFTANQKISLLHQALTIQMLQIANLKIWNIKNVSLICLPWIILPFFPGSGWKQPCSLPFLYTLPPLGRHVIENVIGTCLVKLKSWYFPSFLKHDLLPITFSRTVSWQGVVFVCLFLLWLTCCVCWSNLVQAS